MNFGLGLRKNFEMVLKVIVYMYHFGIPIYVI